MTQTIPPSQIESELEKIWESLQGTNKMRACLFNLIIYGKKGQRAGYLNSLAEKMIQKFPSRIIFVTVDDTHQGDLLETSVSIMTADEGASEIVCDLINIDVAGESTKRIPFLILPHILPDLPVYLVYAENPCKQDPLSYRIEQFATRVIFDSESAEELPAFAKTILEHKEKIGSQIADLNWARIESWRNLFTDTFQTPEHLEELRATKKFTIEYNSKTTNFYCHTKIQSVFLQAWVATRLGWQLKKTAKDGDKTVFEYEGEHGPIQVELVPQESDAVFSGRIMNVELVVENETIYSFFRKKGSEHHVLVDRSSKMSCSLPKEYIFDKAETGQSLVKEVCHPSTSQHFVDVMQLLSTLKGEELC